MPGNGQPALGRASSRASVADEELEYLVQEAPRLREDLGLPGFLGVLPAKARNLTASRSLGIAAPIHEDRETRPFLRGSGPMAIMTGAGVIAAVVAALVAAAIGSDRGTTRR